VDANGCIAEDTITTSIGTSCANLGCEISSGPDGATLFANADGGTPPYNHLWSTGEETDVITTTMIGTYSLTVTDANNCTSTCEITITTDNCDGFSVNIGEQPPGSGNLFSGVIGGTPGYNYLWSNGEATSSITVNGTGTYSVTVEDSAGCVAEDEIEL